MTRLIRPGVPVPAYRAGVAPVRPGRFDADEIMDRPARVTLPRPGGPRPASRPNPAPVQHEHGSRRQEVYRAVDNRTAIKEQWEADEDRLREQRQRDWINSVQARRAREESDRAVQELRVIFGTDTRARRTQHVTPDRRVQVFRLARELDITSAQCLLLVNVKFGEYAKASASTVATIVVTEIREWAKTDEGAQALAVLRKTGALA